MKKLGKLAVLTTLVTTVLASQAMTICPAAIQQAATGAVYHCINSPGGSNYGYLHFTATGLKSNQSYRCQITSNIVMLTYNSFQSAAGVGFNKMGDGHTPFTYELDTSAMQTATGSATVKMFVPPSDMTSDVTFSCKAE